MIDNVLIRVESGMSFALAGPLMRMTAHIIPDAAIGEGGALTLTSETHEIDMEALDALMDFFDGYKR